VLYFLYLGESAHWAASAQNFAGPLRPKTCMVGDVHDVITCAKFQTEIFMGDDFTGGVEFSIFLLIFAWTLHQCNTVIRAAFW